MLFSVCLSLSLGDGVGDDSWYCTSTPPKTTSEVEIHAVKATVNNHFCNCLCLDFPGPVYLLCLFFLYLHTKGELHDNTYVDV